MQLSGTTLKHQGLQLFHVWPLPHKVCPSAWTMLPCASLLVLRLLTNSLCRCCLFAYIDHQRLFSLLWSFEHYRPYGGCWLQRSLAKLATISFSCQDPGNLISFHHMISVFWCVCECVWGGEGGSINRMIRCRFNHNSETRAEKKS